jgi:carboxyl-terminal processing protease
MMRKTSSLFLTWILLAAFAVYFVQNNSKTAPAWPFSGDLGEIINETKTLLDTYRSPPTEKKLVDEMIHGFVNAYGDKFTQYFSPDELLSFQTMIEGDFEGIGAYVEESPNGIYISWVLPGSPAQKSGLLPGDIIQSVDGFSMHGKTANEAVQKIRWPAGTPVILDIFSSILSVKKQVTLIRQEVIDNILHIELLSFNDHSWEDVDEVLQKNAGKYTTILLDLRNNWWGTLQAAVDVWSLFLSAGRTIATVEWKTKDEHISRGAQDIKIPLFILVNGQTASAAEILASALHTHLWAPILGSQTYGKGSVQELFPLKNGGQIKITTAHWRTAAGDLLDGVGITPDVSILPTPQDITEGLDGQKNQAIAVIKERIKK